MDDLVTATPETTENDPVSVLEQQVHEARREHERRLAVIRSEFVAVYAQRARELHQALDGLWDNLASADVGLSDAGNKAFKKTLGDFAQLVELLAVWAEALVGTANETTDKVSGAST